MAYSAKIIADSITNTATASRLVTMEISFPRIVLAEFNTHRVFSRNSASSRAIPVEKQIKYVVKDPFIPIYWGKNQKGMQADQELTVAEQLVAERVWLGARDAAIEAANQLLAIGVHKQITNRLLEPWMWQTVIVTATHWTNFFNLRTYKDAQPEIQKIAKQMRELFDNSYPRVCAVGDWHLPYVQDDEREPLKKIYGKGGVARISAARCARVSYLTHEGKRDPDLDFKKADELQKPGHMSPFEHPAVVGGANHAKLLRSNFSGLHGDKDTNEWIQYRKMLPFEDVFVPQVSK